MTTTSSRSHIEGVVCAVVTRKMLYKLVLMVSACSLLVFTWLFSITVHIQREMIGSDDVRRQGNVISIKKLPDMKEKSTDVPYVKEKGKDLLDANRRATLIKHSKSELHRFIQTLHNWPKDKPKAAVYLLIQPHESRFKQLKNIIRQLDQYYNKEFKYPVVLFHEKDFNQTLQQVLRNSSLSDLYFQMVEFSIPSFLKEEIPEWTCTSQHKIGYRHMCRFHSKLVFEQPVMKHLEYYWRLDDDSKLLRPIKFDLFEFMKNKGILYAYRHLSYDACVEGLWDAADKYVKTKSLQPTFFYQWPFPQIYYNNFEISHLSIWMSHNYTNFINYIDQLGGIFYHRWGDAPLKTIGLSFFVPKERTHHFKSIGYSHLSFTSS